VKLFEPLFRGGLLAILYLGLAAIAVPAAAEGELRIRVHGFADGVGFAAHREAVMEARYEAIREILRSKVASGDLRPFRSMVRKSAQYVTRVEELHIDTQVGQTRVEVDAYVDMRSLEQDLAALVLPRLPEAPTVSCLIAVETDGAVEIETDNVAEAALVSGLKNLGLNASPHTDLKDVFRTSDFHDAVLGDVLKSAAYARETLADVVLIGIVAMEPGVPASEGAPARTRGTLTLKVFRGHDGDLIDVFSRSAAITGLDPDSRREEVMEDVSAKMLGDIAVATVLSVLGMQQQDQVLITLHNPGSRARLGAFMDVLQMVPLIDTIEESFFSERLARIRLRYTGNMGYLVDQIRDRSYEGWPLEIKEVVGRDMDLVLIAAE